MSCYLCNDRGFRAYDSLEKDAKLHGLPCLHCGKVWDPATEPPAPRAFPSGAEALEHRLKLASAIRADPSLAEASLRLSDIFSGWENHPTRSLTDAEIADLERLLAGADLKNYLDAELRECLSGRCTCPKEKPRG